MLRNNAAITLLRAGVDVGTVSKITRHSLSVLMRIYDRVTLDAKREGLEKAAKYRKKSPA